MEKTINDTNIKFAQIVLDRQSSSLPTPIKEALKVLSERYELIQNSYVDLQNEWTPMPEETQKEFEDAMVEQYSEDASHMIVLGQWLKDNSIDKFILLNWW